MTVVTAIIIFKKYTHFKWLGKTTLFLPFSHRFCQLLWCLITLFSSCYNWDTFFLKDILEAFETFWVKNIVWWQIRTILKKVTKSLNSDRNLLVCIGNDKNITWKFEKSSSHPWRQKKNLKDKCYTYYSILLVEWERFFALLLDLNGASQSDIDKMLVLVSIPLRWIYSVVELGILNKLVWTQQNSVKLSRSQVLRSQYLL